MGMSQVSFSAGWGTSEAENVFVTHTAGRMGSSVWGVFRSHGLLVAQFVFLPSAIA